MNAPDTQTPAAEPAPFTAAELRRISAEISARFFRLEESTRLVLLDIGPWRLHAYWNITEADLTRVRHALPDAPLVLRFTDLSPDAPAAAHHGRFDVEVQGVRNNWYLDLWHDAKRYAAELGLRAADGRLVRLARSNEIEIPRAAPAPELRFDQAAAQPPEPRPPTPASAPSPATDRLLEKLYPDTFVDGGARPSAGPSTPRAEPCRAAPASPDAPRRQPAAPPAGEGEDEPAPRAGDGFPQIDTAVLTHYRQRGATLSASAAPATPLPPTPDAIIGPDAAEFAAQPQASTPAAAPANPATPATPAAGDAAAPRPVAPPRPSVALEQWLLGGPSSHARGAPQAELQTELCVSGRVAPGARLTLFGRELPVDAEGAFELRRRLPADQDLALLLRRLPHPGEEDA